MKIGIIFAMEEELKELLKFIKLEKEYQIYELKFYEGKIENKKVILVQSGIGKVNSARCCQILIDNAKVNYIFCIGVAGGISPKLNILDIVIADKLIQHDFDITAFNHKKGYIPNIGTFIPCDKSLIEKAQTKDTITGTIATGDIFCTDKKMSEKIYKKFNALCVEMEGASIAQVCYLCKVPFLIIRSISDCPNNKNEITYEKFLKLSAEKVAIFMKNLLKKL